MSDPFQPDIDHLPAALPEKPRTANRRTILRSTAITWMIACGPLLAQSNPGTAPGAEPAFANASLLLDAAPPVTDVSHLLDPEVSSSNAADAPDEKKFDEMLNEAGTLRADGSFEKAEELLVELLGDETPERVKQAALLQLAEVAQAAKNPARAQSVYAQFLVKWPDDLRVPEVLLQQGKLFRQMGLNSLALTKFYGVMTSALVLKNDRMSYYVQLVQQAQLEIAETHYALGKYVEAAEFFRRLYKQTNTVSKSEILFKLTRCHSAMGRHEDTIAEARTFLEVYPAAPEQPEIRFHLAVALKELGRDNESLQQVLLLLQEQKDGTRNRPALWAYWQQRAGNLIANHLYREGDYTRALEIYLRLAELDPSPAWQVPVKYQAGITYERLLQPEKAAAIYADILRHEKDMAAEVPSSLTTIFDMARWRAQFIQWQAKAEQANRVLDASTSASATASLQSQFTQ